MADTLYTRLTRPMIMRGQSEAGGWNLKQLQELGIVWPPRRGWIDRLIGEEIERRKYDLFIYYRKNSETEQEETPREPSQLETGVSEAVDLLRRLTVAAELIADKFTRLW